ncbi:EAL domain-containing protein [Nocardioides seonyuensis]|uniref:EAL domain-containing protein n=1 Tax=Nocardioides seonyuensis TaxID=2518371 RepID=A0A4P7IG53_9ACTN|nr:EAL domain-containing protein [Nocardioides seonyuensis]QBX54691.1 EAL domain-containing protein [Nocardioides seonyuensis]
MTTARGSLARLAGWTLAFVVAGLAGRGTAIDGQGLALVWPAAGVAVLWLASGDRAQRRVDVAVLGLVSFVINVTTGAPADLSLVLVVCNVGQAVAFVELSRRWLPHLRGFGGHEPLRRVGDLITFFAAALVACALAAAVGVVGLEVTLDSGSLVNFLVWWGRNTTGILVVGLLGILLREAIGEDRPSTLVALRRVGASMVSTSGVRGVEITVLTVLSTSLYAFVFIHPQGHPFAFLLLVFTFWAALRFTPLTVHMHAIGAGTVAITATLYDLGPFLVLDDLAFRALISQVFYIMVVVAGLALALTHSEERSVSARLAVLLESSKLREEAVTTSRDRAERLFQDAPHGVAVLDTSGVIRQVNPALCDLLGSWASDLVGLELASFGDDHADATLHQHILAVVADAASAREEAIWTFRTLDGSQRVVSLSSTLLRDADGPGRHAVLTNVVDISERHRYQERLTYLADHDPLTGLANRRKFQHELQLHLKREDAGGAVLMLDLDHFKDVNDSLGHGVGDQLLVLLARALRGRLREGDVFARLGGDEFAVLLPEADLGVAERAAEDIVALVREHMSQLDGVQRRVTVSVGGVVIEPDDSTVSLLATADTMLYDAKEAGRNRVAVLDRRVHAQPEGSARMMWAERIDTALARDDFELHLQPILDVATGRVTGAEALLRMRYDGEIVMPGQFLPVAERSETIVQLDRWVVRRAVELLATLQSTDPGFRLSINLSAKSVHGLSIEDELRAALELHGADPRGLVLEITETAALRHIDEAREFIERLRPLGCRFALDDFGAGFGSFYYFKNLHFDVVKIDGQFVDGCAGSPMNRAIISSVAQMATELGKTTVAEFVTDSATLEVVDTLGVDFAQGYHVGRPIPVDDFIGVMHAREQTPSVVS